MRIQLIESEQGSGIFVEGSDKSLSQFFIEEVIFDGTPLKEVNRRSANTAASLMSYGWKYLQHLDEQCYDYWCFTFERK